MSTLRHERVGSEIAEPDSELRAALQRVARDFEHESRHLGQDQDLDLQQDKHGDGLHRIRPREGTSIHVEDILDQVSSTHGVSNHDLDAESWCYLVRIGRARGRGCDVRDPWRRS